MVDQMTEYALHSFLAKQVLNTQSTEWLKMTCGFIEYIIFTVK